jgi:hypothetical protein
MINFNQNKFFSGKLRIAASIIGLSTLGCLSSGIPGYAGAQSMLDPYANIQPPSQQQGADALGNRTSSKKPHFLKQGGTSPASRPISTANSAAAPPGFIDGIKEIGHGFGTSFKATGRGFVHGAKSIGSTIKGGFGAAGSKIASAPKAIAAKTPNPKKKNQPKVAMANSSALVPQSSPSGKTQPLPGKPLGPLLETIPHTKQAKAPAKSNKNVVGRTFDKLNPFAKHKKAPTSIAANNQKPGT